MKFYCWSEDAGSNPGRCKEQCPMCLDDQNKFMSSKLDNEYRRYQREENIWAIGIIIFIVAAIWLFIHLGS